MRCWTSDGNPLAYWPFRIRAVQGHTRRAISTAAASDTFNATLIYANSGAAALAKVAATGKTIVTPEDTPGVVYHRTTRGNWKGILDNGFIPFHSWSGKRVFSGRAHSYFSEARVEEGNYVSGIVRTQSRAPSRNQGRNAGSCSQWCSFHQNGIGGDFDDRCCASTIRGIC